MAAARGALPTIDRFYRGRGVCVTGGAGFIGSHLVEALVECGAVVSVIDDFSNGFDDNLAPVRDRVRLIRGSILNDEVLRQAMEGAGVVFHQAALCSVPRSVEQPQQTIQVNTTGTARVLEAARQAGVQRVVFAASSSAYGDSPDSPKIESMPMQPLSPYAASKCAAECLLRTWSNCYGLSTISLRYFNIFGPRQRPDSPYAAVIPRFIDALRRGAKPVIHGDGTQTRDFTPVANAVHANLLAGACEKPLMGEVVNIACGRAVNLLELVEAIARLLNVKPACELDEPRAGDVKHSLADIAAARALIGYQPLMSFEDGLRLTVETIVASMANR